MASIRPAASAVAETACFHCGEPVPPDVTLSVSINGEEQPMCCVGCQAVASMISGAGLDNFYAFRTAAAGRPEELADAAEARYARFDQPSVQREFVYHHKPGVDAEQPESCEASLLIDGLYCAACGWLIERSLGDADGIDEIRVNPATGRALLRWRPEAVRLSSVMAHLQRLGYTPHPILPETSNDGAIQERRRAMRRLIVAGLGMMQAMMFATALYFGQFYGMEPIHEQFLRLVSLLVATPVVLYAALPIFLGAIRDLRNLAPGMDVPVSLAIGSGYFASVWVTFMGGPEVYFDSIAMFAFFLLVARHVEMTARHKANATTDALGRLVPASALRLEADGSAVEVLSNDLQPGDRVLVRSGASVPADGQVTDGEGRMDESMLTGESKPVRRHAGMPVVGGSINLGDPITVRIDQVGQDTMAAHIGRLLRRAQAERPSLARLADRVARYFVSVVLIAATVVFLAWWQLDPALAFPITLAMLVATCPCALSLATPTALAAGTNRLARRGLLITRGDSVETLAKVDHVVFDKTGTLTRGRISVVETRLDDGRLPAEVHAIVAALEQHADHPIARALSSLPRDRTLIADAVRSTRGCGIDGEIDGVRWWLGRPDWVAAATAGAAAAAADDRWCGLGDDAWVALGNADGLVAAFRLSDPLRDDAAELVASLQQQGIGISIASGDAPEPVAAVAAMLGITHAEARLSPDDKLKHIKTLQKKGKIVLMVGDGINDAPVLAAANVSAALNEGSALAQTSAAMVLLGGRLSRLADGLAGARSTLRIVRQNLTLSACYNASVLPLAALGWVPPWLAAIGMTLSSLVVVLNANRLNRGASRALQTAGERTADANSPTRRSTHRPVQQGAAG